MIQTPLQQRKENMFNTELALRGLRMSCFTTKFAKAEFSCIEGHTFKALAADMLNRPAKCRVCVKQAPNKQAIELKAKQKQEALLLKIKQKEITNSLIAARALLLLGSIKVTDSLFICAKAGHVLPERLDGISCPNCNNSTKYTPHVLYLYEFEGNIFGYGRAKNFKVRDGHHRHVFKRAGVTAVGKVVFTGAPAVVERLERTIYHAMKANNLSASLPLESFRREAFKGKLALSLFLSLVEKANKTDS